MSNTCFCSIKMTHVVMNTQKYRSPSVEMCFLVIIRKVLACTYDTSLHDNFDLQKLNKNPLVITTAIFTHCFIFPRSTKTHPGPVVHLSDSPKDEGKVGKLRKRQTPSIPWFSSGTYSPFITCSQTFFFCPTSPTSPPPLLPVCCLLLYFLPLFCSAFLILPLAHRKILDTLCLCSHVHPLFLSAFDIYTQKEIDVWNSYSSVPRRRVELFRVMLRLIR